MVFAEMWTNRTRDLSEQLLKTRQEALKITRIGVDLVETGSEVSPFIFSVTTFRSFRSVLIILIDPITLD